MIYTGWLRKRTSGPVDGGHVHIGRKLLGALLARMDAGGLAQGRAFDQIDGVLYEAVVAFGQPELRIIAPAGAPLEPRLVEDVRSHFGRIVNAQVLWSITRLEGYIGDGLRDGFIPELGAARLAEKLGGVDALALGDDLATPTYGIVSPTSYFVDIRVIPGDEALLVYGSLTAAGVDFGLQRDTYASDPENFAYGLDLAGFVEAGRDFRGPAFHKLDVKDWYTFAFENEPLVAGYPRYLRYMPSLLSTYFWQDGTPDKVLDRSLEGAVADLRFLVFDAAAPYIRPTFSGSLDDFDAVFGEATREAFEDYPTHSYWYRSFPSDEPFDDGEDIANRRLYDTESSRKVGPDGQEDVFSISTAEILESIDRIGDQLALDVPAQMLATLSSGEIGAPGREIVDVTQRAIDAPERPLP